MDHYSVNLKAGDQDDQEIALIDILLFLKRAWKSILIAGLLGLAGAVLYLIVTPNQYEAVANITMGRYLSENPPTSLNIEEPQALINRMNVPTSYEGNAIQSCGFQDASSLAAQLSKVIKLSIPKGVANVVELRVIRPTPELAKECANSVFEIIAQTQARLINALLDSAKDSNAKALAKVEERLAQDKALLVKADQSKSSVTPVYFALLTEIRNLEDSRDKLVASMDNKDMLPATLQSQVYVADQPIYPKKVLSLFAGLMGGIFLGVFIALARQILPKLKMQMQEAV